MGVTKGDTRSVDYGSNGVVFRVEGLGFRA